MTASGEVLVPKPPLPLRATDHVNDGKPHVLIACTGSVATIKLPLILKALAVHDISVRVIVTSSAAQFLQGQSEEQPPLTSLLAIPRVEAIYTDRDEWSIPWTRGADILHIELRRWADIMLVAPLSANSLAKMAAGMSDSLVLSVIRAWDTTGSLDPPRLGLSTELRTAVGCKPLLVAPAMNTAMWNHPATSKHLNVLENEWGISSGGWIEVLQPTRKELACGDVGSGAMEDWRNIVNIVEMYLDVETTGGTESKFQFP